MALCLQITVNDGSPVIAGLDDISVLTACITYVASRNDLELRAGGLVSNGRHDNEHIDWLTQKLITGDHVSIRIVDVPVSSPPVSRERHDAHSSEREEREYYEQLKNRYEPK